MPKLQVLLLSAENCFRHEEVQQLNLASAGGGELGILPGHTALVAAVERGEVTVRLASGEQLSYVAGAGFVEVKGSEVTVLVDEVQLRAEPSLTYMSLDNQ